MGVKNKKFYWLVNHIQNEGLTKLAFLFNFKEDLPILAQSKINLGWF